MYQAGQPGRPIYGRISLAPPRGPEGSGDLDFKRRTQKHGTHPLVFTCARPELMSPMVGRTFTGVAVAVSAGALVTTITAPMVNEQNPKSRSHAKAHPRSYPVLAQVLSKAA